MSDINDRLDRLESLVEQQQEIIEQQRDRIDDLEADECTANRAESDAEADSDASSGIGVSRRDALKAGGLLALLGGVGAGTASASSNPQGKVGTKRRPLTNLYTNGLASGSGQGRVALGDDLDLGGHSALDSTGSITLGDDLDLSGHSALDSTGSITLGDDLDLSGNVVTDTAGPLTLGSKLDLAGNHLTDSAGDLALTDTNGTVALRIAPGSTAITKQDSTAEPPNVVAGHPDNSTESTYGISSPKGATVAGGGDQNDAANTAGNDYATVGGGQANLADGQLATVPGGSGNVARGTASFAAGTLAAAASSRAFVWNDGSGYHSIPSSLSDGLSSDTAVNGEPVTGFGTFSVSAQGGVRFVTGSSSVTYIEAGTTGWSSASSRALKTNIDPVDPEAILEGVTEMEVATWEYEDDDGEGTGTRHVGPMAEDFHEVVDVSASDDHINSVDADGVAFAAIQGLSQQLDDAREELDAKADRIEDLEAENDRLRERNAELEARLDRVEAHLGVGDGETGHEGVADD